MITASSIQVKENASLPPKECHKVQEWFDFSIVDFNADAPLQGNTRRKAVSQRSLEPSFYFVSSGTLNSASSFTIPEDAFLWNQKEASVHFTSETTSEALIPSRMFLKRESAIYFDESLPFIADYEEALSEDPLVVSAADMTPESQLDNTKPTFDKDDTKKLQQGTQPTIPKGVKSGRTGSGRTLRLPRR